MNDDLDRRLDTIERQLVALANSCRDLYRRVDALDVVDDPVAEDWRTITAENSSSSHENDRTGGAAAISDRLKSNLTPGETRP